MSGAQYRNQYFTFNLPSSAHGHLVSFSDLLIIHSLLGTQFIHSNTIIKSGAKIWPILHKTDPKMSKVGQNQSEIAKKINKKNSAITLKIT